MIEGQTSGILKRKRFKLRCSKPVFTACTLCVSISNGRYPARKSFLPAYTYRFILTTEYSNNSAKKLTQLLLFCVVSHEMSRGIHHSFPAEANESHWPGFTSGFSGLLASDNRKSCENSYCITMRSLSPHLILHVKTVSFLSRLTKSADKPLSGMLSETTAVVKTQPL